MSCCHESIGILAHELVEDRMVEARLALGILPLQLGALRGLDAREREHDAEDACREQDGVEHVVLYTVY